MPSELLPCGAAHGPCQYGLALGLECGLAVQTHFGVSACIQIHGHDFYIDILLQGPCLQYSCNLKRTDVVFPFGNCRVPRGGARWGPWSYYSRSAPIRGLSEVARLQEPTRPFLPSGTTAPSTRNPATGATRDCIRTPVRVMKTTPGCRPSCGAAALRHCHSASLPAEGRQRGARDIHLQTSR